MLKCHAYVVQRTVIIQFSAFKNWNLVPTSQKTGKVTSTLFKFILIEKRPDRITVGVRFNCYKFDHFWLFSIIWFSSCWFGFMQGIDRKWSNRLCFSKVNLKYCSSIFSGINFHVSEDFSIWSFHCVYLP